MRHHPFFFLRCTKFAVLETASELAKFAASQLVLGGPRLSVPGLWRFQPGLPRHGEQRSLYRDLALYAWDGSSGVSKVIGVSLMININCLGNYLYVNY